MDKLYHLLTNFDSDNVQKFCIENVRTALIVGVIGACYLLMRKPRGIPPGPIFTIPILGDLPIMFRYPDPRDAARNMRRNYGDVFSFYFGQVLTVYLNGYDVMKEALVKHADVFSERPVFLVNDILFSKKGLVFSSGEIWKDQRKFSLETLREFGFGRSIMEEKITREIEEYLSIISKQNGEPYDISSLTKSAISNIIASMIFGERFEYDDPNFQRFLKYSDQNFQSSFKSYILNFIPVLRFLPGEWFDLERTRRNIETIEETIIHPSIRDHEKNFDKNDTRDFISSYLKEAKKGEKPNINKDNLPKVISDLFVAGTETTSTALLWTILYLLHHPEVQQKCYEEIEEVVGTSRLPTLKDKEKLKYNQAVILESLRLSNITISGVARCTKTDTEFRGYFIPKGTTIIPNLDSILQDDDVWGGDAATFRPERFLDANGQVMKREEFVPFCMGRRVCLGESLAKMELFLFLVILLQRFELKPVDPDNLPTLQAMFGITRSPCKYKIRALLR